MDDQFNSVAVATAGADALRGRDHPPMVIVALTLFLLSLLLIWIALRLRRRTGIPWVPIVASDMEEEGWQPAQRPLFASRYALTGKPDYLLVVAGRYVPVEVKPGRHAPHPYESDLLQLVAYCVLIEETMGQAPPYGCCATLIPRSASPIHLPPAPHCFPPSTPCEAICMLPIVTGATRYPNVVLAAGLCRYVTRL